MEEIALERFFLLDCIFREKYFHLVWCEIEDLRSLNFADLPCKPSENIFHIVLFATISNNSLSSSIYNCCFVGVGTLCKLEEWIGVLDTGRVGVLRGNIFKTVIVWTVGGGWNKSVAFDAVSTSFHHFSSTSSSFFFRLGVIVFIKLKLLKINGGHYFQDGMMFVLIRDFVVEVEQFREVIEDFIGISLHDRIFL